MKKLSVFFALCSLSFSSFAFIPTQQQNLLPKTTSEILSNCPQAESTTSPSFCSSFESVAKCQCNERAPSKRFCRDMTSIYNQMIDIFKSIERACEYQHDVDKQTCIDDWHCFRDGGSNSSGGLCSSTGGKCQ